MNMTPESAYSLGIEHGEAYKAGYDSVINKPDTTNCNFIHFSSKERMEAWERGKKQAEIDLKNISRELK